MIPPARSLALLVTVAGAVSMVALLGVRATRPTVEPEPGAGPSSPPVDPVAEVVLADRTLDRLDLFRTGAAGRRISLTSDEVTAVLRHAVPGLLPDGVTAPTVRLDRGLAIVEARLATLDFVGAAQLSSVLGVMPDTIVVDLRGRLRTVPGRLVFTIEHARASGIPLPRSAVATIAAALAGGSGDRFVPADGQAASLSVRWPEAVAVVAVVGDRLVLDRTEPIADRAVDGSDMP